MALSEGSVTVATANTATVTTVSFTPAADSLVVAMCSMGNGNTVASSLGAVTDSVGSTWTRLAGEASTGGGVAEVWCCDAGSSPAARTVTYDPGGAGTSGVVLAVRYYTGALPRVSQPGATAVNGGTATPSKAITTTTIGALVVGAAATASSGYTLVANANSTILGQVIGTSGDTSCAWRASGTVTTPGSLTFGFTNTTSGAVWRMALAEIKPAPIVGAANLSAGSDLAAAATATIGGAVAMSAASALTSAGVIGPQSIAKYYVSSSGNNTNTLTTSSFVPANGEVVVVKMTTWDTATSMGSVTGGSQTWTSEVIEAPGGFNGWAGITCATITGSPGSMTVSATPSGSSRHNMVVERWSNAQLAATPATGSGTATSGPAGGSLTTTGPDSVITWAAVDLQSVDPATRAYLGSATEEGVDDGHVGSNSVQYFAYQAVPAAGSTSFGLSAPTGQKWVIAGLEVQALGASGGQNGAAALTAGSALTVGATRNTAGAVSMTATSALVAAATQGTSGATALTAAAVLTTTAARVQPGAVAMTAASSLTAAATVVELGAAAISAASSLTAAATQTFGAATAMSAGSSLTTSGDVVRPGAAAMTTASGLSAGAAQNSAAALAMASASSLTAGGTLIQPAAAAMSAGSSLSAGSSQGNAAAVAMTAASALAAAGTPIQFGAVSMSSASLLTAGATSGAVTGSAMSAASGLTSGAGQTSAAATSMAASSSITSAGIRTQPGAATVSAASGMSVAATQAGQGVVPMSAGSSLAASGTTTTGGIGAILGAASSVTVSAIATGQGAAPMDATSSLSSNAGSGQNGAADMGASSALSADAVRGTSGVVAMGSTASLSADGLRVVIGAAAMSAASNLGAAGSVASGGAGAVMSASSQLTADGLAQLVAVSAMSALSGLTAGANLGLRAQVVMTAAGSLGATLYVPPQFYRPGVLTPGSARSDLSAGTLPHSRLTAGTVRGPTYSSGG
jgi:hypothetical protein